MVLFTDRPPAEVTIERKDQQRDGKQRSGWSVEVKLSFSEEDNVWGRVELLAPRLLAVTLWLSNEEQARLATQNVSRLEAILKRLDSMSRAARLSTEPSLSAKTRRTKSVGNLELRA